MDFFSEFTFVVYKLKGFHFFDLFKISHGWLWGGGGENTAAFCDTGGQCGIKIPITQALLTSPLYVFYVN